MTLNILITGANGYVGSRLQHFLKDCTVDCVDITCNNTTDPSFKLRSYADLTNDDLAPYDAVVHLAAHSSVSQCKVDPDGAVTNNITGFADLLRRCRGKRLIYASSSSVYNGCGPLQSTEKSSTFFPNNRYDVTKYTMDLLSLTGETEFYSLRFGTVCGASPHIRTDLMINRMVLDALKFGRLRVTNPEVYRPILDIDDLCRAVRTILTSDSHPGIYNLASFNDSVLNIAKEVARLCDAEITMDCGPATYDFSINCDHFCQTYGFDFRGSIASIVSSLMEAYSPLSTPVRQPALVTV